MYTKKIHSKNQDNYKYIYCFGDSHTLCFGHGDTIINEKYNLQMLKRDSVSARGLSSLNSKTGYNKYIIQFILNHKYSSKIGKKIYLFKFGQIDNQVNYYYNLLVKKESINKIDFYSDSINKYIKFLTDIKNYTYNIIVCGSNLPNPLNYQNYLYSILGLNDKEHVIDNLTIEEMNKDTIIFNKMLQDACDKNNIVYFDLTDECTYNSENNFKLKNEFIGNDHHYNGSHGLGILNNIIREYNLKNKCMITDYINHPLFNLTYKVYIDKLIKLIETKFRDIDYTKEIKDNEISLLPILNFLYYIYHNNVIKYNINLENNKIIINIEQILSNNGKLDFNMSIFGCSIKFMDIKNKSVNMNCDIISNLPIKIYDGEKWIHHNKLHFKQFIIIKNIAKWRISPSNNYLQEHLNHKNIEFKLIFNKLSVIPD